ncbi:RNA polymerase sigma factor [Agrobacterium pusense]|uniref:RNA polymerase sigma factor n=1 Tax=Agrobacterium pusense TaxID=648995 RepID=UPI0028B14D57|nr:sigma-70 family RNA polymerase sigma factor [Agrobacterium pusense]
MSWDIHNLFRRHATGIAKSLRRRGMDSETAADLTQDTFLKVLVSPPSETAKSHNPKAYLYQAARNLGIDHNRHERLLVRVDLSDEDFAAIADPAPSVEILVYDRQKLKLVEAALAELPRRVREAFELHRMGELTIVEVAKRLEMSTTRTWVLIRDAYEHIEDRLNGL